MKKFFHFVALLSSLAVLSNFMSCSSDSSDDSSSSVNGPGSLYSSDAPDISITYNMNYEGAEATVRTEKGNSYIPLETFEREGYSLIGWADSADAGHCWRCGISGGIVHLVWLVGLVWLV